MTDNGHIFISYSRNDGDEHAGKLESALKEHGFGVWRDIRNIDPTRDFTADIENGIENASHMVVCATPDIKRDNSFVRREIQYALLCEKPIIMARFADIKPPISIVNNTWVDFLKDWKSALARLYTILTTPDYAYKQTAPQPDPFRPYLQTLLRNVARYLKQAVIRQIDLSSESVTDAVRQASAENEMFSQMFGAIAIGDSVDTEQQETFTDFGGAFERYEGRVLLLGAPGAGKTITLMAHTRDAAVARLEDPSLPLPLFAVIPTWDAWAQTPLTDWLAGIYKELNTAAVQGVISQGRGLLLLDGLDELGSERPLDPEKPEGEKFDPRQRFIQHIPENNRALVTCRVEDYDQIGQKVALNGAVKLQPLDDAQMQNYLREHGDLWAVLQDDPELREVARTPLLLSLFTFAFAGLDKAAQELRDLSGGELRDKIFGTYIERRYKHEDAKHKLPYTLEEMVDMLGKVAMDNVRSFWLEDWWGKSYRLEGNALRWNDFFYALGTEDNDTLIKLATRLNILTPGEEDTFRFVHLFLRDYLAFRTAMSTLKNEDADVRHSAANTLGKLGDIRAVEPLITALKDGDAGVRSRAVSALGKLGDVRAVDPLIIALKDEDRYVRLSTGIDPGELRTLGVWTNAFKDIYFDVRSGAAESLGKLGDVRAVDPLINTLKDEDKRVRRNAVKALGKLGDVRAVDPLINTLKDEDKHVRRNVAEALDKLRDVRAVEPLINALKDEDKWVRRDAAFALGELGDVRAITPLTQLLSDNARATSYSRDRVCDVAARALEKIGTPEALAAVAEWRKSRDDL